MSKTLLGHFPEMDGTASQNKNSIATVEISVATVPGI